MHNNLIVDVNNNVFAMKHGRIKPVTSASKKEKYVKEFLFIETLKSILRYGRKLKADSLVLMQDSPNIWRRDIYPEYKANHINDAEDFYYQDAVEAADMLCSFIREYTKGFVFSFKRAEADDLIGIWCQESVGVKNTILSSDKDFVQLLSDTTVLYSQTQDTFRESDDAAFDLFVKCIRGDRGDNIRSAYPRIQEKKLKLAWDDDLNMLNMLETIRPDGIKVGDALLDNIALIDLSQQPTSMRNSIVDMFETAVSGAYSPLKAMKFFGDNNLKEHRDALDGLDRVLKNAPIFKNTK